MNWVDPVSVGDWSDERYDNDQSREDIHEAAHNQEKEIQQDQFRMPGKRPARKS